MGVLLDMGAQFGNLDPSYIAETLTRQIVASMSSAPQIIADITYWMSFDGENMDGMNYYQAGASAGRLVKVLFDFTINN